MTNGNDDVGKTQLAGEFENVSITRMPVVHDCSFHILQYNNVIMICAMYLSTVSKITVLLIISLGSSQLMAGVPFLAELRQPKIGGNSTPDPLNSA